MAAVQCAVCERIAILRCVVCRRYFCGKHSRAIQDEHGRMRAYCYTCKSLLDS